MSVTTPHYGQLCYTVGMTQFQKLSLLIGALVLILLVALIAVTLNREAPAALVSSSDQTATFAVEFFATNIATAQAMQTSAWMTLSALTATPP